MRQLMRQTMDWCLFYYWLNQLNVTEVKGLFSCAGYENAHRTELTFVIRCSFMLVWCEVTHYSSNRSNFFSITSERLGRLFCMIGVCNPLHNPDQRITARCAAGRLELPTGSSVIRTYRTSLLPDYCWLIVEIRVTITSETGTVRVFHRLRVSWLKYIIMTSKC